MTFILSTPHLRFLHFFCAPGAGKLFCKAHRSCGSHVLRHPFVAGSAGAKAIFRVGDASALASRCNFVNLLAASSANLGASDLALALGPLKYRFSAIFSRWHYFSALLANGLQFRALQRFPAPLLPCSQLVDVPFHSAVYISVCRFKGDGNSNSLSVKLRSRKTV